jgi:capsular polysaccharide biosynthesis protein
MAEDQEIQALKERIIILETKIDMLSQSSKERPFLINVLIGFIVTLGFILLISFLLMFLPAIVHTFR